MAKKRGNGEPAVTHSKMFVAERMATLKMETKDLAEAMDVSNTAAWRYEHGRRPAEDLVPKLAAALKCTVAQLYIHPDMDSADALLAGLDPEAIQQIRGLIEFHRWKDAKK